MYKVLHNFDTTVAKSFKDKLFESFDYFLFK